MSTLLAAYSYNALNRRIIEDDGTTATHLFYSASWQVLEEQVSGQTTTQYVWSPVYIDAMILRDRDTDSDGNLDERLYVQQDANYNISALVDALTGNVVQRFVQDPFGLVTVLDSGFSPTADAFDWKYLHQGLRLDQAVGMNLYDGRNRIYDPVLQRWFQVDPSGFSAGDSNLYRFVENGSTNATDPMGLQNIPNQTASGYCVDCIVTFPQLYPETVGVGLFKQCNVWCVAHVTNPTLKCFNIVCKQQVTGWRQTVQPWPPCEFAQNNFGNPEFKHTKHVKGKEYK